MTESEQMLLLVKKFNLMIISIKTGGVIETDCKETAQKLINRFKLNHDDYTMQSVRPVNLNNGRKTKKKPVKKTITKKPQIKKPKGK